MTYLPEWLPKEALAGEEWEECHATVDMGTPYYYRNDQGVYCKGWMIPAYRVKDGVFYVSDQTVNTDMDWDFGGWEKIESEEALDKHEHDRYHDLLEGEIEYLKHIAETGEDSTNYFLIGRSHKATEKWQVRFSNSILGPVLRDARKNGRGEFLPVEELPEELTNFLMVGKRGDRWIAGYAWDGELIEDPMTLKQLSESDDLQMQRLYYPQDRTISLKGVVEIKRTTPCSETMIKRELQAKARKALRDMEKYRGVPNGG